MARSAAWYLSYLVDEIHRTVVSTLDDEGLPVCPQQCIALAGGVATVDQSHCLHCGRCADVCPEGAVERR